MHYALLLNAWQAFPREKSAWYLLLIRPAVISLCAFSPRAEGQGKRRATDITHSSGSQEGERRPRSTTVMSALNSQQLEVSPTQCLKYPSLPLSQILVAVLLQELSAKSVAAFAKPGILH